MVDGLIVAVTERRTKAEIDGFVEPCGRCWPRERLGAPVRRQGPPGAGTIRDLSRPGRRAWSFARWTSTRGAPCRAPGGSPPALPEVAELELVRHYTRLSQQNYGVDTGFYPLGSCSMKYNPKVAETVASLPGFQRLHPLQPDRHGPGSARDALVAGASALRGHRDGASHLAAARGRVR